MRDWSTLKKLIWAYKISGGGLPDGYTRLAGITFNNGPYYKITGLKLTGADTVRVSFLCNRACNVFGCYTDASAQDNYSLYVSTTAGAEYMRYDGGTYRSDVTGSAIGSRLDVVVTPTGTHGLPHDDTWTQATFTTSVDMCIGTTSVNATSTKMDGDFYGNFVVVGKFCGVPCERESDGAIGYYDTFSKTFYAPTGGTPTPIPITP